MKRIKRAYIGFSGPLGYAYMHNRPKLENETSSPNAVLENVAGLLICYDELYFPAKNFCPVDMWDLPYVHFLLEDNAMRQQTITAVNQALASDVPEELQHGIDFDIWSPLTAAMQGGSREAAIDNHTHGIEIDEDLYLSGNSGDPQNILIDIFVAQSMSVLADEADLILSSPSVNGATTKVNSQVGISEHFTVPQRSLAEGVVMLHNQNFLSSRGSYHESYEELREHPHIREFREMLASTDIEMSEVSKLAIDVNRRADEFSSKVLQKVVKGPGLFRSLGLPAMAGLANSVVPAAGTVANLVTTTVMDKAWKKEIKNTAWAPFVVDAGKISRYR